MEKTYGTKASKKYEESHAPLLHKGDVVKILPDVEHWRGASPKSEFTHIAINPNTQKGIVVWLQRVTDEEYNSFKPVPAGK